MILLLRLAAVLHRARRDDLAPDFKLSVSNKQVKLKFSGKWLEEHPLLQTELQDEQDIWKKIGYKLEF